ncbi:hypothetical protein [Haliangium sp.]|uniref:hypothetical protein n=1 Tax=Haliangium sp. TaxID=2663208 RepID=UPI003D0FC346
MYRTSFDHLSSAAPPRAHRLRQRLARHLAPLVGYGLVAAGCGATIPDISPFAGATASLYEGMELVGSETSRQLAPLTTPIECPASAPAAESGGHEPSPAPTTAGASTAAGEETETQGRPRTSPQTCFERLWTPRVVTLAAFAAYAERLAQITSTADSDDQAQAAMSAVESLLGELSVPALPSALTDTARQALAAWRREQAAKRLADVVARASPHVDRLAQVLLADLDDTRALLVLTRSKLRLDRVSAHNDELSLRRSLERRRRALIVQVEQSVTASGTTPANAGPSGGEVLAELERIQALLAALPSEDSLTPSGIDTALAAIDAGARALTAWRDAHARLAEALTQQRTPSLHRLQAATQLLRRVLDLPHP